MTAFSEKRVKRHVYDLILIRGAPGVGKTTLAEGLKVPFPQGITAEIDSFKGMVYPRDRKDTTTYYHIIEAEWMACRSYLDNGYSP